MLRFFVCWWRVGGRGGLFSFFIRVCVHAARYDALERPRSACVYVRVMAHCVVFAAEQNQRACARAHERAHVQSTAPAHAPCSPSSSPVVLAGRYSQPTTGRTASTLVL